MTTVVCFKMRLIEKVSTLKKEKKEGIIFIKYTPFPALKPLLCKDHANQNEFMNGHCPVKHRKGKYTYAFGNWSAVLLCRCGDIELQA